MLCAMEEVLASVLQEPETSRGNPSGETPDSADEGSVVETLADHRPTLETAHVTSVPSQRARLQSVGGRLCWVCFATDEDDADDTEWISPCICRGSSKWVHQRCLQRWIDEKQRGESSKKVSCPQCNTEYIIVFPSTGTFVKVLEQLDKLITKYCPFCAAVAVVFAGYWTLFSYGAIVVMQIREEGLEGLESTDPLFLLVTLPLIPLGLVIGKMVRWEEVVLKFWRAHVSNARLLKMFWPGEENTMMRQMDVEVTSPISATRVFCGALIFPFVATLTGKLLYSHRPKVQRTVLGALTFVCLKGVVKLFFRQQQYWRQTHRSIKDYSEMSELEDIRQG